MPATPKRKRLDPAPGARFMADVVAANVRDLRVLRRFTQSGLAAGLRQLNHDTWSSTTVSEVERGRRSVSVDELLALAIVLNVELVDLLDPTGIAGEESAPLDYGGGRTLPAAVVRPWLRSELKMRLTGPDAIFIESVEGYDKEFNEAHEALRGSKRGTGAQRREAIGVSYVAIPPQGSGYRTKDRGSAQNPPDNEAQS